jgi:FixJ family two-component response regulator
MSVHAMKAGAVDFLAKPFSDEAFLSAVGSAIELDLEAARHRAELTTLKAQYDSLTAREKNVLPLIVAGLLNKQGAAELGISPITFQIHRSNVMKKMRTRSVADLVRIAARLEISIPRRRTEAVRS